MRSITFVRHGDPFKEIVDGVELMYPPTAPLSETGKEQIIYLRALVPENDTVFVSPMERALETAHILTEGWNNPKMIVEDRIRDIFPTNALGRSFKDVLKGKIEYHPNDESIESLEQRVCEAYRFYRENLTEDLMFVGHGHGSRILVYRFVEQKKGPLPPMGELEQYNYLNPGEAFVVQFDEAGHVVEQKIVTQPTTKIPGVRQR